MSLVDRWRNILLRPQQEWRLIDAEATSVGGLFLGYILPLAAIGPVAWIIRQLLQGQGMAAAILGGLVRYLIGLVGVVVVSFLINALAPAFSGQRNQIQAFKVTAYASTAAWTVAVLRLIPSPAILQLLGLYSLYLLYLGLPTLMKTPRSKALWYTIVVVIVAVAGSFILSLIVFMAAFRGI